MKYTESIYLTRRRKTREVKVGNVGVGGTNPVRIQSMATSSTRDIEATVDQIIKLADSGCEIARITVQGKKEADACEGIKNTLVQKGYDIPLVADIHFYPPAAMRVIDFVEKVRINPGNFIDRRATFREISYDDKTYAEEIERIEEKFSPLVEKCIKLKRAMRIGTNHGSLSDRIMNRYGDTPFGMVESALEFARVCRNFNYHDFLFSMKASNPVVMIQAYRLLAAEMDKLGWDYPLHLGVTEAGEGEDGRIKSAVGIGSLLLDGIGDTIRVSLTEDPWAEIDPCSRLIQFSSCYEGQGVQPFEEKLRNIEEITARTIKSSEILHRDGSVILHVTDEDLNSPTLFEDLGCKMQLGRPERALGMVDGLIYTSSGKTLPKQLLQLQGIGVSILTKASGVWGTTQIIQLTDQVLQVPYVVEVDSPDHWESLLQMQPECILFKTTRSRLHEARRFFEWLKEHKVEIPVLLAFSYDCEESDFAICAASECGALLADKLGEGVALEGPYSLASLRSFSFGLLQAARMRSSKTEFISCPGCGRTLFNLQEVSKRIREKTAHLPGVKIAIMGCIVNGPGEMADADFGYVGSRPGKIDLYVGKTCVERNIDFADADERLVELIKSHGRWVEPVLTESGSLV